MGTSEVERETQQILLRRIVGGLAPATVAEQKLVITAQNLVTVVGNYSLTSQSAYLAIKEAKRADRIEYGYTEFQAQMAADIAKNAQKSAVEDRSRIKELLAELD